MASPSFNERDVSDKPAIVRDLPPMTEPQIAPTARPEWRALEDHFDQAYELERLLEQKGDRVKLEQMRAMVASDDKLSWLAFPERLGGFGIDPAQNECPFSVDPSRQGQGLGTTLLRAAEEFCRGAGCRTMEILVVNLRTELPPYYRRHGYIEIGVRPFPAACHRAGRRGPRAAAG